jgi:hypothetical protein
MADTVFISYAMKNQEVAERLVVALEKHGLRCWIATRDIPLGASWPAEISNAISGSRLLLVVLSGDASKSEHLAREVGLAVEAHVPIFPLKIDDTAPSATVSYFLANVQHKLRRQLSPTSGRPPTTARPRPSSASGHVSIPLKSPSR